MPTQTNVVPYNAPVPVLGPLPDSLAPAAGNLNYAADVGRETGHVDSLPAVVIFAVPLARRIPSLVGVLVTWTPVVCAAGYDR